MTRTAIGLMTLLLVPAAAHAQRAVPVPPRPPTPPTAPATPPPRPAMPMPAPMPPDLLLGPMDLDLHLDIDPLVADVRAQAEFIRDQAQFSAETARAAARAAADQAVAGMRGLEFDGPGYVFADQFDFGSSAGAAYRGGLDALQQRQYDRAITAFDRVVAAKADRADAALYWKAFAQFKLSRTEDALASLAQLRRDYGQSRYLADARVLEADVRRTAGQPVNPANVNDDEIKLLAIQGLRDSDQAVPLLQGVLNATNSLNVKKRALYVLALNDDARAHQVLLTYAKGGGNPDLQMEAIGYLAARRDGKANPTELREIYDASTDPIVKMAVINAYRSLGDKTALLRVASDKGAPVDVRRSAILRLNGLAEPPDVMALYQQEPDPELRQQYVTLLASVRAVDQLVTIAKTDKDPNVRQRAVRSLGSQRNSPQAAAALVTLYGAEQDKDTRRTLIQALSNAGNAEALVSLARQERDVALKTELVRRLSDLAPRNKVAADYLVEQLK